MPSSLTRLSSIAAILIVGTVIGEAQGLVPRGAPQQQPLTAVPPGMQPGGGYGGDRMAVVDPDKKLSAGDVVTIEILEDREGGFQKAVTAAGDLDITPYGRVKVTGRNATEAAAEIKRYLERDFYYTATVRVAIDAVSRVQVRSGVVYLSGEVRTVGPQEIVAGEALTLTNAVLKAAGLTVWADTKKVKLMRQENGKTVEVIVNYKKVLEEGDVNGDPVLRDGDRIFVPKRSIVF